MTILDYTKRFDEEYNRHNYFFSTRPIFLSFAKFNFFRSLRAFSSMTWHILSRLTMGANEGRPWAHWNGA